MNIEITLNEISWGSEFITLKFGDKVIKYDPTYVGIEALSSLVHSVVHLGCYDGETVNLETEKYHIQWETEPGILDLSFYRNKATNLTLLKTQSDSKDLDGLEIEFNFDDYKKAVIRKSLRVLKQFGINGFNRNWCDGTDTFPINSLIMILGSDTIFQDKTDTFHGDIYAELDLLKEALIKLP